MIIHVWFREADESFRFRPEVAERIARQGTLVNSTLHTGRATTGKLAEAVERARQRGTDVSDDVGLRFEVAKRNHETQLDHTRRLRDLGVQLIPGTDSGFSSYPFGGFGYELECLVLAGFTPMGAIQAATRDASRAIGVSNIVGTLEQGKEADLVVVAGDPCKDIKHIHNVLAVFQGGAKVR
jgi:imidazolonepropionase-like amidohydrolase